MNTETTTTKEITHLGVTAPLSVWELLGYQESEYRTDAPLESHTCYTHTDKDRTATLDALVLRGMLETGKCNAMAIAWAIGEISRRNEERTRATGAAREAQAISELAKAMRESGEQAVLERIIARLSERTQYAVRQQLKATA